jgi:hypothetical protein
MGGTSCALINLGYIEAITSGDGCTLSQHGVTLGFPRTGFGLYLGDYCLLTTTDVDPDADGTCNRVPETHRVTPAELSVCFDDMQASQIYRAECHVPH